MEHLTGQWLTFLWRCVYRVREKKVTGSSTDQDVLLGRIWQQYFPNHESRMNNTLKDVKQAPVNERDTGKFYQILEDVNVNLLWKMVMFTIAM